MTAFTPEQEARLRELIREEIAEYAAKIACDPAELRLVRRAFVRLAQIAPNSPSAAAALEAWARYWAAEREAFRRHLDAVAPPIAPSRGEADGPPPGASPNG